MAESRWRNPSVPTAEALLLLPQLPQAATVLQGWHRWSVAFESSGIVAHRGRTAPEGSLLVAPARAAARAGNDLVLVDGRDRSRRLQRAGYRVLTYVARRGPAGAVHLTPLERGRFLHQIGQLREVSGPRQLLIAGVRRLAPKHYVTIAHRGAVTPAAVAAAVGPTVRASLVAGGGGARRRSTFLVGDPGGSRPHTVVKVAPLHWRDRGTQEQKVLRLIQDLGDLAGAVPRPLGEGLLDAPPVTACWSAESAAQGRPLPVLLRRSGDSARILATLAGLATWFTRLAAATRTVRTWADSASVLPLRGDYGKLQVIRESLRGVPGVLVHGDVGTGGNVLVDRDQFSIIDWETTAEQELPLTDLLPLLCNALALLRGHRAPASTAAYILRLCAGRETDSAWLLSLVRDYCKQVGVPVDQCGALGALAWGYQASMQLVHHELVVDVGGIPAPWESPADDVARRWLSYGGLGLTWPALTARNPT